MPALNRVELIGNLGRDPETRYTPTGKKVCHFTLAVNHRWRSSEGEAREATDWFNIDAWGRLGEICQEYLKKGSLVYIAGRLQTDRYEVNGEIRFSTRVVARELQMLAHRTEEDAIEIEEEIDPPAY